MSKPIDLNQLAAIVRSNQKNGRSDPQALQKRIFVDRNAQLKLARDLEPEESRRKELSVVQQDTFHHHGTFHEDSLNNELDTVRRRMPENTSEIVTREGVRGWMYEFINNFGELYRMFAYRDGSYWQVLVVHPILEDRYRSPHTGHIFSDGRICFGLGMESGRKTLADAYAKSVLWSNGLSAMIHSDSNTFPFNHDD